MFDHSTQAGGKQMVARIALVALLLLAGCQTIPKGSFCGIAKPIRPSQKTIDAMSDREVKELLSYLETGRKLCKWKT